jgi:AraC-like DNA-binding protein
MAILELMLLFLSILGLFLSLILLYFNTRKNVSTIYLGGFFLLISLYGFYQYVLLYSKSVFLNELLLVGFAIVFPPLYLIGPMMYWYIRSILTDNSQLKRRDLWHLLPMIIFFLAALPYTFVPFSDKVEAATEVVKDVGFMQTYNGTILDQIFSVSAIYLSRPILVLVYTLWSMGLLLRYSMQRKVYAVFSRQYFMTKWLCLLLGFLLVLVVTQILLIIKVFAMDFSELFFSLNVLRILSVSGLMGLLISPFFFPAILYGLPRIPESVLTSNTEKVDPDQVPGNPEKKANHFETEYIHFINQKADFCMKEVQPYLQPDFNMAHLSVHIQIPVHHLSYYFREEKKQHFNDYRNEWRINHAKDLIKEGKADEFTLETIGLLSGFSSRNTFLTTFKKVEGITPSTCAAQMKN